MHRFAYRKEASAKIQTTGYGKLSIIRIFMIEIRGNFDKSRSTVRAQVGVLADVSNSPQVLYRN